MKFDHTKSQINLSFNGLQVVKIFTDHTTFVLLPYLIFGLLSGLLNKLCLKMIISLQSPPRELNMQCINNDFDREQI